jgi:hypothetical protein
MTQSIRYLAPPGIGILRRLWLISLSSGHGFRMFRNGLYLRHEILGCNLFSSWPRIVFDNEPRSSARGNTLGHWFKAGSKLLFAGIVRIRVDETG